jgi:CheY-like chemotaxis protein
VPVHIGQIGVAFARATFLHSRVAPGARERPVILVVDSNDDVREMYCAFFTFKGYECIAAATGDEAMKLLLERVPDLVLLEESVRGIDGWRVLQTIRANPLLRSIQVVMLTADVFEMPRERAEHLGADGFAAKPVLVEDLARLVRRLLKSASGTDRGLTH